MANESTKSDAPNLELISDRQTKGKVGQWTKASQPEAVVPNESKSEINVNDSTSGEPEALTDEEKDARDEEILRKIRAGIDANSDNYQSPTFKINQNKSDSIPKSEVNISEGLASENSTVAASEDSIKAKLPIRWTQNADGKWISSNPKNITPTVEPTVESDDLPVDANFDLSSDDGNDGEDDRFEDFKDEDTIPEPASEVELNHDVSTPKVEPGSHELLRNAKRQLAENMLKATKREITPEQENIIKSALHGFSAKPSFLDDLNVWVDKTNDLKNPKFNALFRAKYSKNENKYLDAFEIVKNLNQKDLKYDDWFNIPEQVEIINHIIEVIGDPQNHGTFEAQGTGKPLGN